MNYVLRPDQLQLKAETYGHWQAGARNVLIVQPTGGGKSVVVSDIVKEIDDTRASQTVIAHRRELVGQMSLHVARVGVRHRIIAPPKVISHITALHRFHYGRSFVDPNARAAVAGIDTLNARADLLRGFTQQCSYWTIDEAHHVLDGNKWGNGVKLFPNARGLGVTATPERADGNGLSRESDGVFDAMVLGPTMRQLIDMGALTDYQIVIPKSDFKVGELVVGASGEYTPGSVKRATENSHIVGDVVKHYLTYANGKLGVTFAPDVKTANDMAERFNAAGIPAVSISADTDETLRDDYIERFRAGQLRMLVNVDLFGEGFDLPAIEVVIMARPTASLAVYLQQFGRALRIMPGKLYGLVIDCVSNVANPYFGLPDKHRLWSLGRRERRSKLRNPEDDIPVKTCVNQPACGRAYSGLLRECPYCGTPPVPMGGGRSIEQVDGDLILLDFETLAAMRKNIILESAVSVAARSGGGAAGAAGGQARQIEKIEAQRRLSDTIALWAGHQRAKGRSDAESYRRFYFAAGTDVLGALTDKSRKDFDALNEMVLSWI